MTIETWMNSLYSIAVRLLDFDQTTVFFVGNSSFTQVVLIVSSFLQNDLPDAPSKSFHWAAITIYNASALLGRFEMSTGSRLFITFASASVNN